MLYLSGFFPPVASDLIEENINLPQIRKAKLFLHPPADSQGLTRRPSFVQATMKVRTAVRAAEAGWAGGPPQGDVVSVLRGEGSLLRPEAARGCGVAHQSQQQGVRYWPPERVTTVTQHRPRARPPPCFSQIRFVSCRHPDT